MQIFLHSPAKPQPHRSSLQTSFLQTPGFFLKRSGLSKFAVSLFLTIFIFEETPVWPIAVTPMEDLECGHPPLLKGCSPHTAAIRHTAQADPCKEQRSFMAVCLQTFKSTTVIYERFPFPVISARWGGKLWVAYCSYPWFMCTQPFDAELPRMCFLHRCWVFCWKWWIPEITKARKLSAKSLWLRERTGSCWEHLSLRGPCHDLHLWQGIIEEEWYFSARASSHVEVIESNGRDFWGWGRLLEF